MSLINIKDLTFYYEGSSDNIFENVTFQIDTDWKLGFIGRNGRGKTTFLNLLMGKYAYKGNIDSSEVFDYFPFMVEDPSQETIDIIAKLYPENEFWKICRELNLLQVDADVLYRPFITLSNGERTKIMLAVLFSMDNQFLLIDEPTNHLDVAAREIVRDYLKQKKGFILVSHDRDFLDQCIDHVLVINKENIEVYQGNFSTWWENKKRQDAYELSENNKLKKDIVRLTNSAREKSLWADNVESTKIGKKSMGHEKNIDTRAYIGEKSRRMQTRRKNLEKRREQEIEEKSKLLKNIENTENLKIIPIRHYKEILVKMEEVQIYYGNLDKKLKKMEVTIKNGDRAVLHGRNGCGKSSIIKVILKESGYGGLLTEKEVIHFNGGITTASGLIISYVSQDTGFLKGNVTAFAKEANLDISLFLALLRKLDFTREQFDKKMEDYSEGQKKKVLIAKSLCEQAHLYIWDEPLNFIDVFSRIQIEELLLTYRPTMLFVEHDKAFVDKVATNVISCE